MFNVRKKSQPNKLDEVVWGRWKLEVSRPSIQLSEGAAIVWSEMYGSTEVLKLLLTQEESIDRPSEKDLKLHGAKLKPTRRCDTTSLWDGLECGHSYLARQMC
jgi:hypothetical protein